MPAIHIRDVPEPVLLALRERARQHGQSVQQEVRQILEAAATTRRPAEALEPVRLTTVRTALTSTWPRAEMYDDTGR